MKRMSVTEAGQQFSDLVDRICEDGIAVELEQDEKVVARLSPTTTFVRVSDLNEVFRRFPSLDDDTESFADDLEDIRKKASSESDPWA